MQDSPAYIEQLPDLAGYLKMASYPAWLRLSFSPAGWPDAQFVTPF